MSAIETAVQMAIRAVFVGTATVTDLVPASSILDTHQRPAPSPSIILGEATGDFTTGQDVSRSRGTVTLDAHVWKRELSTEGAKAIAGAMCGAIENAGRLDLGAGLHCVDAMVERTRHMRDAGGELSHSVVSIMVMVQRI